MRPSGGKGRREGRGETCLMQDFLSATGQMRPAPIYRSLGIADKVAKGSSAGQSGRSEFSRRDSFVPSRRKIRSGYILEPDLSFM
jgi:hypothetical protein